MVRKYEGGNVLIKQLICENIFSKGIDIVEKKINKGYLENRRFKLWEKSFKVVAQNSELITEDFGIELSKHRTLRRFFYLTFDIDITQFPVESFIIALAMEMKDYYIKLSAKDIVGIGEAIIQMWKKSILKEKEDNIKCFDNNDLEINKEMLIEIINNREEIIKSFFRDMEDINGADEIKIYYPKNGQSWIEWKDEYSIKINLNLNKGVPLGFTRTGYDYFKKVDETWEHLKIAYLSKDKTREIMRVHNLEVPSDEELIIWVY